MLAAKWQAVLAICIDVPRGVICCRVVEGCGIRGWILKVGYRCLGLGEILPALVGITWNDLKESSVNVRRGHEDRGDSPPGIPPNHMGVRHSLHWGCTAGDDTRIALGSLFGSGLGRDTNRGV